MGRAARAASIHPGDAISVRRQFEPLRGDAAGAPSQHLADLADERAGAPNHDDINSSLVETKP